MKKVLAAVLALVVILAVLVLAHPLWIGPVVRTAVARLAPKYLGVPARLDGFSLNFYTGRLTADGFALDNPPGCPEAKFVTVGHLCVDVDPMTVLSDVIVVEEISIGDLYVSLMKDAEKTYNYEVVSESVSAASGSGEARPKAKEPAKEPEKPAPKVIIDLLQVRNALVQWERISLPLPSFRLTGIGRGAGGVEFDAAWKEAETKFVGALGPLAKGLQSLIAGAGDPMAAGLKSATRVTESVQNTAEAISGVQKALKDGSTESLGTAVKTLEGSVKSLKSLFK